MSENKPPQMEARLRDIVAAGPATQQQEKQTFWTQFRRVCLSKVGFAVLTFLLVFVVLLLLRPVYIFKRDQHGRSQKHINYGLVAGMAIIAAALVVGVPLLITKKA